MKTTMTNTSVTAWPFPGADAPSCAEPALRQLEGAVLRGDRLRASVLLGAPRISPVLPVHGSGLSVAGSDDDATALPPRGAPV